MSKHKRSWDEPNRVAAMVMIGLFVLVLTLLAFVPYLLGESG